MPHDALGLPAAADVLMRIQGLTKSFRTARGEVHAVRDVSFDIPRGSVVGLVGESGSGKTTLGRCLLRLIEPTGGTIDFDGIDITSLGAAALKDLRKRVQIIFQDPVSSLNPRMKVRAIIGEALKAHGIGRTWRERRALTIDLLEEVGLAAEHIERYPHEFSGGQRQRIGIARALAVEPDFIVADECVSALDVSVQAQILNLLDDLRRKRSFTMLFIAHDLSVVEYICDRVVVLYLGRVMEAGVAPDLYADPCHPYSRALLSAVPVADPDHDRQREVLHGDIPSPIAPPSGCVFRTRCRYAEPRCADTVPMPQIAGTRNLQSVACHRLGEI
jgi:oligopeptide/dipeptide ABC transporter ATP-binding protein